MPAPRYQDPILMFPENYKWREIGPKVAEKLLGVFNERNTCARMLRLASGGWHLHAAGPQAFLCFVTEGALSVDDAHICQKHDAFYLESKEQAKLQAMTDTTLLIYGMPVFE